MLPKIQTILLVAILALEIVIVIAPKPGRYAMGSAGTVSFILDTQTGQVRNTAEVLWKQRADQPQQAKE